MYPAYSGFSSNSFKAVMAFDALFDKTLAEVKVFSLVRLAC